MAISIDWPTGIVTIPKADTTLVQSSPTEIRQLDLNQLWRELRAAEDSATGRPYPLILEYNQPNSVGGVLLAAVLSVTDYYTFTFEDGQYAVNLIGLNSNVGDRINVNQVSIRSANSAGLVQTAELEYNSFQNKIWIDENSTLTGQGYPRGNAANPVNNYTDALAIAIFRGLSTFGIIGDYTFGATDNLDGYEFEGQSVGRTTLTFTAGCSTSDIAIVNATCTGTPDGAISFTDCYLVDIAGIGCTTNPMNWKNCQYEGTIQVRSDNNVPIHILKGESGVAGAGTPVLDTNGAPFPLDVRGYIGGLEITNYTAVQPCSIDMNGSIIIGSSNTGASFVLRGQGKKTIDAAVTIDDAEFLQTSVLTALIERNSYSGKGGIGLTIAPTTGTDSIEYPYGTPQDPLKTEQNLFDFDSQVFFYRNIYVDESLTLVQDHSSFPHNYFGANPQNTVLTLDAASDLSGSQFSDLFVTGKLGVVGGSILRECVVGDITNMNGFIYNSTIFGSVTVNGNLSMEGCWIAPTAPNQECTIDFNGLANSVIISGWTAGRIRGINMVTGSFLGMAGSGGRLITDTSNTGGTMVYGGAIAIDDTFAANLDLLNDSTTAGQSADKVWNHLKALQFGKWFGLK